MAKLTAKQQRFVEEYPVDFNATRAAERAGYRGSDQTLAAVGYENLRKPHIEEAIRARVERLTMAADEATLRLSRWGRGTLAPFLSVDEQGRVVIDLGSDEAKAHLHLLREVSQTEKIIAVDDEETVLQRKLAIKLHDAKDAVLNVLKMHGKFVEKHEHSGPGGGPIPLETRLAQVPDEELFKGREAAAARAIGGG